ncbi:hypothetical protein [Nakamurella panacisegetis]|nr:hypothetical protein [Nakamurella panacisegetis]
MPSHRSPPSPYQHIWDDAARRAAAGEDLSVITAQALSTANAQIEVESLAAVPAHGRAFFTTLGKALAWAALLDVCVLGIGSFGAGPLSAVRLVICVVALVWATAFGILAANQRVQRARIRAGDVARTVVTRIAEQAAGLMWSSQIPGSWTPLGPPVDVQREGRGDSLPVRWLRRLGGSPDLAVLAPVETRTPADVRRAVERAGGRPVVFFEQDAFALTSDARSVAEEYGLAVFRVQDTDLLPLTRTASAVWRAYRDPASSEPPAAQFARRFAAATTARVSPTWRTSA